MKTVNKRRPIQRTSIDSDSLTSFFIPWQKNRAPPIYPNAQTGRTVTVGEFYLFCVSVILLVTSLGLVAMSTWSIFFKSFYTFLDCSTELAYFAFPVAILCLPCSWIVFSVHNDVNSRKFLPLVLILLIFSILLMVIGLYIGFTHKLNLKRGQMENSTTIREFRESLRQSISKNSPLWDDFQKRFGCCGVDNYTDWFPLMGQTPASCGDNATGCLTIITASLASQTCLFNGINCVALFLQSCAFVAVAVIYFCGKRHGEE